MKNLKLNYDCTILNNIIRIKLLKWIILLRRELSKIVQGPIFPKKEAGKWILMYVTEYFETKWCMQILHAMEKDFYKLKRQDRNMNWP